MTTAIIKVCKFVSAKQYHLYFPQVKREKRLVEKIIFFVQDHLKEFTTGDRSHQNGREKVLQKLVCDHAGYTVKNHQADAIMLRLTQMPFKVVILPYTYTTIVTFWGYWCHVSNVSDHEIEVQI